MNAKHLLTATMLTAAVSLLAQEESKGPALIVRVDDMGAFHSANTACLDVCLQGIARSVEIMSVGSWFPEAVKMLRNNPGIDVGLHLVFTSEWENVKWRPLTDCPGLTDAEGYFLPMMQPHAAYPGQSVKEQSGRWTLQEVEREARAQIEMALRHLPQLSHITGHMGSTAFTPEVYQLIKRLCSEYHLSLVSSQDVNVPYAPFEFVHYQGPSRTLSEKEESFIRMLQELPSEGNYIFVDHPCTPSAEMESVFHIGYEDVATDREGVWRLLTSERVKQVIRERHIRLIDYNRLTKSLPRAAASKRLDKAVQDYLNAVQSFGQEIHSLMILQHGKVLEEKWLNQHSPDSLHALYSVSKTFTATAVGLAVAEGRLNLTDKVASFFPRQLEGMQLTERQRALEVRHLLTMASGHDADPTDEIKACYDSCRIRGFFSVPLEHEPGTFFVYNNQCTYLLSAIVQQITGQKLTDYLYPRLFRPLGIVGVVWRESPEGICLGSGGLKLKTEDLAKLGQLFLQRGVWQGEQILPSTWIEEASAAHIASLPAGQRRETFTVKPSKSDWLQGYGYQMWRCRHGAYRADGAHGQFILMLPEQDAVIVITAHTDDMQAEINLVWKYLLPALG